MTKDIIGLKAYLKIQSEKAVEFEAAALEVYQDAVNRRENLQSHLERIDNYRGGGRKNGPRIYTAPGRGTKAAEIESLIVAILAALGRPAGSDVIMDMVMDSQHIYLQSPSIARTYGANLLPGGDRATKFRRLSTYLTRMHRRENAPLFYSSDTGTYSLRAGG